MSYTEFDENFSLSGKTALVTGAGSGIGQAIALMFARKGANVACVDINLEACAKTARTIESYSRKSIAIAADLTLTSEIQTIVSKALEAIGHIDILVNNAGVALLDAAESLSEEYWNKTMALNLGAVFFVSQEVGRHMISRKYGKIINLASQAALVSLDHHVAYNSSKAGVVAMTKVLACEWAKHGIQVNAISPTVILTDLGKKAWAGEVGEVMKKKIPSGRFGYPEEVAAAAVYLASDAASLVTGSNLVIDGGYTIQ